MKIKATVKLNLKHLEKFRAAIKADLQNSANGPVRQAIRQWAARYRSEMQERFDSYSKGGGDWPALALSTILARRKGKPNTKVKAKRSSLARDTKNGGRLVAAPNGAVVSILRDTGLLYGALNPEFKNSSGQLESHKAFGVTVGFGGPASHSSGGVTIAAIASFHQSGGPHLPKREILVMPSEKTLSNMANDMRKALRKLNDESNS